VPLTDFWNRWRRRLLPPDEDAKPPRLRDAEKQRDAAEHQTTEELAAIPATTSKPQED
jgi:hypothetical protein